MSINSIFDHSDVAKNPNKSAKALVTAWCVTSGIRVNEAA